MCTQVHPPVQTRPLNEAGKEGPVTRSCPGGCCRSGPTLCCPSSSPFIPLWRFGSLSPPVFFSLRPSSQLPHPPYLSLSLLFSLSLCISLFLSASPLPGISLSLISVFLGLLSPLIPSYLRLSQFLSLHLSLPPSPSIPFSPLPLDPPVRAFPP